jgi:hypothetical protein
MASWFGLVEILGVVADVRTSRLEHPPGLTFYLPYWQSPTADVALAIKTSIDTRAIVPEVRAVVRSLDPELPVANLRTMARVVADSLAERRFLTVLVDALRDPAERRAHHRCLGSPVDHRRNARRVHPGAARQGRVDPVLALRSE